MRLIDKDSLLELIKDLEVTYQEDLDRFKDEELTNPQRYRDTQRGRIEGVIDCYIDIYNAEEVKAIPIEFIKQLIEKFDCERGNAIKDTFAHILTGLLEFWEFEQEKENDKGSE